MRDAKAIGVTRLGLCGLVVLAALNRIAQAQGLEVVEPTSGTLAFDHVLFDVQSESQRIRIANTSTQQAFGFVFCCTEPFVVTHGNNGTIDPGREAYWEIACTGAPGSSFFDFEWCVGDCDDASGTISVRLQCRPGSLTAQAESIALPVVFAGEMSQADVTWTNTASDPVTVTGFAFGDPAFTAVTALPQIVAPGSMMTVTVAFDTTRPDTSTRFDVLANTTVVGRTTVVGVTLKQIQPTFYLFDAVPQGAVYTIPIRIRNSSPTPRMIASVSSDNQDFTVDGLVGTVLAPGAVAHGLGTLRAMRLGTQVANLALTFDTGHGDAATYQANVVAPTFEVITGDSIPSDGRVDFGTWRIDAAPVDATFTIVNRNAVARAVLGCMGPGGPAPQFAFVGPCPTSIPAHGSVSFTVRLTPSRTGYAQSGLGVPLAGGDSVGVQLDADIVEHQLALSRVQVEFSETVRGDASQQTVTLTNVGGTAIEVPIQLAGSAFALVGAASLTIAAGASVDITIEFRPLAPGSYSGALEIGSAGDLDHVIVPLHGDSHAPSVTCDDIAAFGDVVVGNTAEATITIRNLDTMRSFRIARLATDNPAFSVELPADPLLPPGATLPVPIWFTPSAAGAYTSALSVTLDDDLEPVAVADLTGNGIGPISGGGCCNPSGSPVGAPLALLVLLLLRVPRSRSG